MRGNGADSIAAVINNAYQLINFALIAMEIEMKNNSRAKNRSQSELPRQEGSVNESNIKQHGHFLIS